MKAKKTETWEMTIFSVLRWMRMKHASDNHIYRGVEKYDLESYDLENDDLENDDLENDDLKNDLLENEDLMVVIYFIFF